MIDEGTDPKDVTPEQIRLAADDLDTFCRKRKMARGAVAKALGYSAGVISEFIKGSYGGNNGQVAIDVDAWLEEEAKRAERPATTQFVWTNVAEQIKSAATYCLDFRKIGMVYGGESAGVGKTTALTAIAEELGPRRCTMVTIDKVDANPSGLIRKICAAMRLDDGHGSNRQKFGRIVDALKGRSHLLLIDQCHNLRGSKDDKPFYILTDLYDATQTAQLWCGTADLVTYLNKQMARSADESLAQIRRRIYPCIDLMDGRSTGDGGGDGSAPLVTVEQVREMFGRNKLKLAQPAARFLCALANLPDSGSIGLCVQLVEYATMLAEFNRRTGIDLELIKLAMRQGFSSHRTKQLMDRMTISDAPRAIAAAG